MRLRALARGLGDGGAPWNDKQKGSRSEADIKAREGHSECKASKQLGPGLELR